jgi:hypothetical protein
MIFDRLRTDDLLVWNKDAILDKLELLPNSDTWRHEELNCYLQVIRLRNDALGADVWLECTHDCGQHLTPMMTRDEYELYFDMLGDDILVFASSMSDVGQMYAPPDSIEEEYDFSQDSEDILEKIINGTLPMFSKGNECQT